MINSNAKRKISEDVVITVDNIKEVGEKIALWGLKVKNNLNDRRLDNLFYGLIKDVYEPLGDKEIYSDGYDIAQEVILFLCNHIGKKLGDLELDLKGKLVSIKTLAMRVVFTYLDKILNNENRNKPYKASLKYETIDLGYKEKEDYSRVDKVLEKLNLSEGEQQVLDIYMSGYGTYEMCRFYNMKVNTLYTRRRNIRKRFNNLGLMVYLNEI